MTAEIETLTFECTTDDGVCLRGRRWETKEPASAVAVMAHGIVEHSGRYAELAESLNRAGIAVWAADTRGHGRSDGDRIWVEHFDRYAKDLVLVTQAARQSHPELPMFLLGHSMGTLIVLRTVPLLSETPAGVILSAPPIEVAATLFPWMKKLAALGSRWFPRLRLVRLGSSRLSRDPEVVRQFRADPLVFHNRIPTRTGAEVLRVSEVVRGQASQFTLPLLILQGTEDVVVSPAATEAFYQAAGSSDKTLNLFPDAYHDLPREPEKDEIAAEIAAWIGARS